MGTIGGQVPYNEDWTVGIVYKCASTSLKEGGRRAGYGFLPPKLPQASKNAIIVIRDPLERVVSWWRNQVRDRGRVSNVHTPNLGKSTELDDIVMAIIRTPDKLRDPHYRSYEAYIECFENVHLVALEKLSETWPRGVPRYMKSSANVTTRKGEWPSPEVEEAFKHEYRRDYRIWRDALRGSA